MKELQYVSDKRKRRRKAKLCSQKKISKILRRSILLNNTILEINMPLTDKFVGAVILSVFGVVLLLCLFYKLILFPLLPTGEIISGFIEPKTILILCQTFGVMFLGGLSAYTYYHFVCNCRNMKTE